MTTIGERLKTLRGKESYRKLAERIGISPTFLSDIRESIERIDMEIEGARKESTWKPFTKADVLSWQNSISSVFEKGSLEVIQKQLHDIIERVIVSGNRIEILYRKGNFFA